MKVLSEALQAFAAVINLAVSIIALIIATRKRK